MYTVANICYKEIEKSDIILVVNDYGKSVASELGYTIALKRLLSKDIKIIAYNEPDDAEAMIAPFIERTFSNIPDLIKYLKSITDTLN